MLEGGICEDHLMAYWKRQLMFSISASIQVSALVLRAMDQVGTANFQVIDVKAYTVEGSILEPLERDNF